MLARHSRLKYVAARAGWYLLTFLVAVAVNFALPRLGDANPVDTIIARAATNLDSETAREKEEAYLREFGLVEVDAQQQVVRNAEGKPVPTSLLTQLVQYLGMTLRGDLGTSILQ